VAIATLRGSELEGESSAELMRLVVRACQCSARSGDGSGAIIHHVVAGNVCDRSCRKKDDHSLTVIETRWFGGRSTTEAHSRSSNAVFMIGYFRQS
jgi:hypothetical protein